MLKKEIRTWTLDYKRQQVGHSKDLKSKLSDINKMLDQGGVTDDILLSRMEVLKQLHDVQSSNNCDIMQKAKIRWAIEGDENSKYFHVIINKNAPIFPLKVTVVEWFFEHGDFAIGCNSAFVALIPKVLDPKVVNDYRPISLIGSLYKVVTKILATRLSLVISDLILDVQTAFLPNRQILDGLFIINEILARCKLKKQQAMTFKVDFPKALSLGKDFILVNGSPTPEFHFHRGLKQGDPLAPFLFLLIIESLHLSFSRAVEARILTGFRVDHSITLSHLFYADDAVYIGMSINIQKSHLLGVGIPDNCVAEAAKSIGFSIIKAPFKYLGILVGDNMSSIKAWDEAISKMKNRLSRNFFNGIQDGDRKITWVKWSKVLASKKYGGLGVSNFYALNRALLFKWSSIINEVKSLKDKGVDLISQCVESQQHDHLLVLLDSVILSNMEDRWFWDLNGDGVFRVKDVRILLDEAFLPKMEVPT
nr:RNA-directed DNA polymerase, eukaryota [Tanacetum cinerariifolium]